MAWIQGRQENGIKYKTNDSLWQRGPKPWPWRATGSAGFHCYLLLNQSIHKFNYTVNLHLGCWCRSKIQQAGSGSYRSIAWPFHLAFAAHSLAKNGPLVMATANTGISAREMGRLVIPSDVGMKGFRADAQSVLPISWIGPFGGGRRGAITGAHTHKKLLAQLSAVGKTGNTPGCYLSNECFCILAFLQTKHTKRPGCIQSRKHWGSPHGSLNLPYPPLPTHKTRTHTYVLTHTQTHSCTQHT